MVTVPGVIPVTMPVPETIAIAVLLLLQEPPDVASVKSTVYPAHTDVVPVIAAGNGLTITTFDVAQPVVGKTYTTVAVPAETPVTIPDEETDAAPALIHVPSADVSVNAVVSPIQTDVIPVIGPGIAFTVIMVVAMHPVGSV